MLVGTLDTTCTYQTALETAATIGNMVVHFESFEGEGHGYFSQANDESFMTILKE